MCCFNKVNLCAILLEHKRIINKDCMVKNNNEGLFLLLDFFVAFPDDGMSGAELWLACSSARTDLLLATHRGWLQYCSLSMPEKPTAACLVGSSVWLGDCIGQIHAYM